jgi:non-canonical (house-cleaning) NTP pyrophosphatase
MWAAVTDGDRWGYGTGPSLVLPERVAEPVREGGELGPVLDDYLGTQGIKHGEGAAGVFTGGASDRTSALAHAVAGALGPFVTEHYEP